MKTPILTCSTLLGLLLISYLLLSFAGSQPSNLLTVYEMLEKFNLPKGILPEGVESYLLRKDGSFDVYLGKTCDLKVAANYLLRYSRKISGKVETGSLKSLSGVRVKIFFLWFGIGQVLRSGDELRFNVGPFSASFPVSSFDECPPCRHLFSSLDQSW